MLGLVSAKGGCGATTIACHTAVPLASRTGRKVLLADFDMEAGLIGFLMKAKSPYNVLDALKNVHRLDPNYWSALISNGIPNLEILSGPQPPPPRTLSLRNRFGMSCASAAPSTTGSCWISAVVSRYSFRAIEEVDEIYIVHHAGSPALHQAKQLIQRLVDSGCGMARIRLLLNRPPKRSDITLDELKTMLGIPVYATIADEYAALQESCNEGKLAPAAACSPASSTICRQNCWHRDGQEKEVLPVWLR